MQCHRLNRHRADRVVRRIIPADFVDRQQLHHAKANLARPLNELAQRRDIADAEIIFSSQSKQRCENTCHLVFRRQIHDQKMTNGPSRTGVE